jgi:hypothetical protein
MDVSETDDQDLETASDDESSSASWETCSELESEHSRIDEGHSFDYSLDHRLDQFSLNNSVMVQDDESNAPTWETYSVTLSMQEEDHSFDHVLDGSSSNSNVLISKLCEQCQKVVDELPVIGRKKRDGGALIDTNIPHLQGPLALEESAETGCSLCSTFLRSISGGFKGSHTHISTYVDSWRARFGETPFPCGRTTLCYEDWRVDIMPRNIQLTFPPTKGPEHFGLNVEGLTFMVDLRISAKPRELPSQSGLDSLHFIVSIQQQSSL